MRKTLKETQRRYLEQIAVVRRPNTVTNSRTVTNDFIRYLESTYPRLSSFAQVTRSHLEGWLKDLSRRPLLRSTRRNKIINLRVFVDTIQSWGWKSAPAETLFRRGDLPPQERCLPKPLSEPTDRLLKQELSRRGGIVHKGLLLIRATGLRSQEFLDLKVDSLKSMPRDQWALQVPMGKLHSERMIPLDAETARIFLDICDLRENAPPTRDPETAKPAHFLFVHKDGRRYSRDALRYHLGKIEREAGLPEHPAPHRLRHTYATEMVRAGMRLPALMHLLGHRTIGMTLRYVRVTNADVRDAYFEALEVLNQRYEIPSIPANSHPAESRLNQQAILAQLDFVASALESYRRDLSGTSQRKTLQRLVERIRRIAADLEATKS